MADVNSFIKSKNLEISGQPKWIVVGSGYFGTLAALLRLHSSELVLGAWSSSAPLLPISNFHQFDHQVYRSLGLSGHSCPTTVQSQTEWLEHSFQDDRNIDIITTIFNVDPSTLDTTEFLYYFASIFSTSVMNGLRSDLCDTL